MLPTQLWESRAEQRAAHLPEPPRSSPGRRRWEEHAWSAGAGAVWGEEQGGAFNPSSGTLEEFSVMLSRGFCHFAHQEGPGSFL